MFQATYSNGKVSIAFSDEFHPNNRLSTFGFHASSTVPLRNRSREIHVDPNIYMSLNEKQRINQVTKAVQSGDLSYRVDAVTLNILKIVGYIPVLGLITCAILLIAPYLDSSNPIHLESTAVKTSYYIRGAASGLGLGAIYILPDIAATVYRFLRA